VQFRLNGTEALALLNSSDETAAFIVPLGQVGSWGTLGKFDLLDEDVAAMSLNGERNILSLISLTRDL